MVVSWQQKGVPANCRNPSNTKLFGCGGPQQAVLAAVERRGVTKSGLTVLRWKTTDRFRTKGNIESEWTNHRRRELEDRTDLGLRAAR
jgi:hypothetical protein